MPGMGTIQGFCARSQARAICAGVAFLCFGDAASRSTRAWLALQGFGGEAREGAAEVVAVEFGVLIHRAGEEALAERAVGHEADAEFFEEGHDLLLRACATRASIRFAGR